MYLVILIIRFSLKVLSLENEIIVDSNKYFPTLTTVALSLVHRKGGKKLIIKMCPPWVRITLNVHYYYFLHTFQFIQSILSLSLYSCRSCNFP